MSQALLHLKEVVSAGPRNGMYHIACKICRKYILHNNSDFFCLAGVGSFFTGEGD